MMEIVFDPILAPPLVGLLGAVLLLVAIRIYLRIGTTIGRWQNLVLMLFRLAGIALVMVLLLQPSRQETLPPLTKERVTLIGLDTSLSMKQHDVERAARLDAARNLLLEANAVAKNGQVESPRLRLFEFSADAAPIAASILDLTPKGKTTRLNKSVLTMLNTPSSGESANALILLTDGHDFELVNPVKTGSAARARQVPIYAVALGKQGKVRDVSVRNCSREPCWVS